MRNSLGFNYKSDCDWLFLRKRHTESALKSQTASRPLVGGRVRGWGAIPETRFSPQKIFWIRGSPKLEMTIASKKFFDETRRALADMLGNRRI
jgi:hypothetical protein